MTSSNGNIFRVTGPLCGEFTSLRCIPRMQEGQWRGTLIFSLICAWTNGWVNNREAGDLRHYRAHYDASEWLLIISLYNKNYHLAAVGSHRNGSKKLRVAARKSCYRSLQLKLNDSVIMPLIIWQLYSSHLVVFAKLEFLSLCQSRQW